SQNLIRANVLEGNLRIETIAPHAGQREGPERLIVSTPRGTKRHSVQSVCGPEIDHGCRRAIEPFAALCLRVSANRSRDDDHCRRRSRMLGIQFPAVLKFFAGSLAVPLKARVLFPRKPETRKFVELTQLRCSAKVMHQP